MPACSVPNAAQTLEERETYLRQLEAEQDNTEDKPTRGTLATPAARYVIKARGADGAKVFINLCSCDKVRCSAELPAEWRTLCLPPL